MVRSPFVGPSASTVGSADVAKVSHGLLFGTAQYRPQRPRTTASSSSSSGSPAPGTGPTHRSVRPTGWGLPPVDVDDAGVEVDAGVRRRPVLDVVAGQLAHPLLLEVDGLAREERGGEHVHPAGRQRVPLAAVQRAAATEAGPEM